MLINMQGDVNDFIKIAEKGFEDVKSGVTNIESFLQSIEIYGSRRDSKNLSRPLIFKDRKITPDRVATCIRFAYKDSNDEISCMNLYLLDDLQNESKLLDYYNKFTGSECNGFGNYLVYVYPLGVHAMELDLKNYGVPVTMGGNPEAMTMILGILEYIFNNETDDDRDRVALYDN